MFFLPLGISVTEHNFQVFISNFWLEKSHLKLTKMSGNQLNWKAKIFRKTGKFCFMTFIPKDKKKHYAIIPGKYFVNVDPPFCAVSSVHMKAAKHKPSSKRNTHCGYPGCNFNGASIKRYHSEQPTHVRGSGFEPSGSFSHWAAPY